MLLRSTEKNNIKEESDDEQGDISEEEPRKSNQQIKDNFLKYFATWLMKSEIIRSIIKKFFVAARRISGWKHRKEMKFLNINRTLNLIELPEGNKPIGCKWTFKMMGFR
ncbi:hypothetical protein TNCV_2846571 [Trichonephila clavipes]|nr:hypothetical protein TNCV_2846571 [Trichonephila clavipes]